MARKGGCLLFASNFNTQCIMKKITLTFLLVFSSLGLFAQEEQEIYFTVFQPAPNSPAGWTKEMVSGDVGQPLNDWYYGETVLPLSSSFSAPAAVFNDDANFAEESNIARIVSRVFDLSQYNTASMSFEYGLSRPSSGTLTVEVFNGSEWISVLFVNENTEPIQSNPIELTSYKNPLFQVRFTYSDEGAAGSQGGAGVTNFKLMGSIDVAPNDLIDNATMVYCGDNFTSTNALATPDSGIFGCGGGNQGGSNGVWYKYISPEPAVVTFSLCESGTDFNSHINVFKGFNPEELECGDASYSSCGNLSKVTFDYSGNTPYYIFVTGTGTTTGTFTVKVSCSDLVPPNDEIINAIDADQFEQPYTDYNVSLTHATSEADAALYANTGCDTGPQFNVFYKFTATSDGEASVSIGNPSGLQLITFYTAPNENATIGDLTWVNQESNLCNVTSEGPERHITTTAGTTYYVVMFQEGLNSDITIDISSSLSTSNNTIEGFGYSPNPVISAMQLTARTAIDHVSLYNLLGQQVKEYTPNALNAALDMSGMASGTYVMKVLVNGTTGTYKIIKQ